MNLSSTSWITICEDGSKFGLETGTRVIVKASELQAYLRWWENNRAGYYRPAHWSASNQAPGSADPGALEDTQTP